MNLWIQRKADQINSESRGPRAVQLGKIGIRSAPKLGFRAVIGQPGSRHVQPLLGGGFLKDMEDKPGLYGGMNAMEGSAQLFDFLLRLVSNKESDFQGQSQTQSVVCGSLQPRLICTIIQSQIDTKMRQAKGTQALDR